MILGILYNISCHFQTWELQIWSPHFLIENGLFYMTPLRIEYTPNRYGNLVLAQVSNLLRSRMSCFVSWEFHMHVYIQAERNYEANLQSSIPRFSLRWSGLYGESPETCRGIRLPRCQVNRRGWATSNNDSNQERSSVQDGRSWLLGPKSPAATTKNSCDSLHIYIHP